MKYYLYIILSAALLYTSCNNGSVSTPKPRSYFRIDFPEKKYQLFHKQAPYTFEFPLYGSMYPDSSKNARPGWYNLAFPRFNARLHISYYTISGKSEFNQLVEDSRKLAFKHTVKATGIDEASIRNPKENVYGIYYTIEGNTASSLQFYLTDSARHYLRGALYFHEQPKQDSIQPVLQFLKKDIDHMIKTFKWRN